MANALYLAEVDWSGNGSFLDSGEDVTGRVRGRQGIKISRGRDQIRALAPPMAGSLTLTLDNTSRDYSAENAASPLAGNLVPGRKVRVWGSVVRDTFDRANSASSIGNADVGGAWTVVAGTWGITNNLAYSVNGNNADQVRIETGSNDQRIVHRCYGTLNHATDFWLSWVYFRWADASNYLLAFLWNGTVRLRKVDGGVSTDLASVVTTTADATWYELEVIALGATIQVLVDGVLLITHTLAGGDETQYTGAGYTQVSLFVRKNGSPATAPRWDDLVVYVPLALGYLDDLIEHPEPGVQTVELKALGLLSKLRSQAVSTQLYQNITTDTALGYVLDAVGLTDTALRVFDTGKTTLDWWWLDEEDAFDAAVALLNSEGPGASLYEDALGRVHFESRHYRLLTTRSTTSQATISDTGTEPLHSIPLKYNPGRKDVVNECLVTVKRRSAKALAAVWSLGETVTLAPNEVREYVVTDDSGDPFTAAVNPVAVTDYTLTAGSLASATLDRTSGASATLTLTAGASGATLTGLQVRAQTVSVDNQTKVRNTIDTSASQTAYGVRTYTLQTRAEIASNTAQDFANAVVSRYQTPRPIVMPTLNNGAYERLQQALLRQISDRVTIVEAHSGLNTACWIERIEHVVGSAGLVHRVQFGAEKAVDVQYAVWGTTVWSNDAGTTTGKGTWGY